MALDLDAVRAASILVVDDEMVNLRLIHRILERAGYRNVTTSWEPGRILELFKEIQPDLILLDLHMPGHHGFDVLKQLRPHLNGESYVPVLMMTGDGTLDARRGALELGARDFLAKPFDQTEVLLRIQNLLEMRLMHRELAGQKAVLQRRVLERTADLELSQLEVLERLAGASEFRDDDTGRHTQRVGAHAAALAALLGLEPPRVELIRRAAPLHDVGKIGIPDSILLKPGKLTDEEFGVMQTHTTIGARILSGGSSELVTLAESIARSHHERWDGAGYPRGLSGESIPIEARIVAVADVVDALSHDRPYRRAWPLERVRAELERGGGSHFDPAIVQIALSDQGCGHMSPGDVCP